MSLTIRLLDRLSRRSRGAVWLISLSVVLMLGVIDYLTGTRIIISFFYLLPVSFASWSLGKRSGWVVAVLCALVLEVGQVTANAESGTLPIIWNTSVRLGTFLVVANLTSEFRRLLRHQTELSRTDPLTGILNRRAFMEAGERLVRDMDRRAGSLTVAFMDVDDFKAVNDGAGHLAGDALLVNVARCLKSKLWGSDTVARLGGDEFAILLPDTGPAAAQRVLPRLREYLLKSMEQADSPVTVSIGALTCVAAPPNVERLVHAADQLMYDAKRAGKNRIEYAVYPDTRWTAEDAPDTSPARRALPQP